MMNVLTDLTSHPPFVAANIENALSGEKVGGQKRQA